MSQQVIIHRKQKLFLKLKNKKSIIIVKSLARQGSSENFDEVLKLKGQMLYVKEWDSIIYLATPV